MFRGKQEQVVNVNELMAQMNEGVAAINKIESLKIYLTRLIDDDRAKFARDKANHEKEGKEYYTFYYPFVTLNDELRHVAELIGYQPDEALSKLIKADLEYALEWNRTHGKED